MSSARPTPFPPSFRLEFFTCSCDRKGCSIGIAVLALHPELPRCPFLDDVRLTRSPKQGPARTSSPFGSAIRQLASPVPDFASTLTVAEDEIHDANVSFLRHHALHDDDEDELDDGVAVPAVHSRDSTAEGRRRHQGSREMQHSDRTRLQDQRDRQFQAHRAQLIQQRHESQEAWAERMTSRAHAAYGDRIPHQQSLYDWAPAQGGLPQDPSDAEMGRIMALYRERHPNLRDSQRDHSSVEQETQRQTSASPPRPIGQQEPSLRSAAILQSVSRNWRFSNRSRALMSRYVQARDGATQDAESSQPRPQSSGRARLLDAAEVAAVEELARTNTLSPLRRGQSRSPWPPSNQTVPSSGQERDSATLDSLRRRYLENPSTKVTEFERIIKYLHRVRLDDAIKDLEVSKPPHPAGSNSQGLNMDQEMVRKMDHVRPHRTSWLTPGMTFIGHQQAAPMGSSTTLYRLAQSEAIRHRPSSGATPEPWNRHRPTSLGLPPIEPLWLGRNLTATPQNITPSPAPASPAPNSSPPDTWTVKVALHAVDYDSMTLQGTMEAFNVPSFTSSHTARTRTTTTSDSSSDASSSKTTFSTYVEGELIDFTKHTLLTESDRQFALKTTADIDAAYWRKLEPFAQLSDEEIARALLDRKWIEEQLMGKYVLMRWKERCFVRPTFTSFSNRSVSPRWHDNTNTDSSSPTDDGPNAPPPPSSTTSFLAGADGNGYGLSISGFYYVSMRRSDGHCEGLYFDPQSSPYQRLELTPTTGGLWGAGSWEMR